MQLRALLVSSTLFVLAMANGQDVAADLEERTVYPTTPPAPPVYYATTTTSSSRRSSTTTTPCTTSTPKVTTSSKTSSSQRTTTTHKPSPDCDTTLKVSTTPKASTSTPKPSTTSTKPGTSSTVTGYPAVTPTVVKAGASALAPASGAVVIGGLALLALAV